MSPRDLRIAPKTNFCVAIPDTTNRKSLGFIVSVQLTIEIRESSGLYPIAVLYTDPHHRPFFSSPTLPEKDSIEQSSDDILEEFFHQPLPLPATEMQHSNLVLRYLSGPVGSITFKEMEHSLKHFVFWGAFCHVLLRASLEADSKKKADRFGVGWWDGDPWISEPQPPAPIGPPPTEAPASQTTSTLGGATPSGSPGPTTALHPE
ncbi:uncharacterized protein CEXT_794501 [Caerostris extrusa]|uniref:Uncharacterized protein n=1 Tax=Caerostris extrusa TaxID=172846 RepID=A0AAV4X7W5_CAEEX|nr:uncharacterized protein CEXT_794501 [Caerostris extrusa]